MRDQSQLREDFIEGMSRAASTVSIVTTDGPAGLGGVTVSAMTSVSADGAAPSLLICVHHLSAACRAIRENRVFCVNLLRDDHAFVADCFAGRVELEGGDKFACADWQTLATGAPSLRDPLVAFDCELRRDLQWGTHLIFIGELAAVRVGQATGPLVYANRDYGQVVLTGGRPAAAPLVRDSAAPSRHGADAGPRALAG